MDALSEVLKSVRLEGAMYLEAEFSAPWAMLGKYGMASVRERLLGAEHVVFFHYVVEGTCLVRLANDKEVIELSKDDLVLFPHDDRHLIGSDLHVAPLEADNLFVELPAGQDSGWLRIKHGGGGTTTKFVCGYLACNRAMLQSILESIPRVLRIPMGTGDASRLLRSLLSYGMRESALLTPGSNSMLAKLAELMFMESIRQYIESMSFGGKGVLAGLKHPQVGKALALLHARPERSWTVDLLSNEVGLSKTTLVDRFAQLVGQSPMQYLQQWRMAVAARLLKTSADPMARIAEKCGYESEAAFNRAFKRRFGLPPATWRRGENAGSVG